MFFRYVLLSAVFVLALLGCDTVEEASFEQIVKDVSAGNGDQWVGKTVKIEAKVGHIDEDACVILWLNTGTLTDFGVCVHHKDWHKIQSHAISLTDVHHKDQHNNQQKVQKYGTYIFTVRIKSVKGFGNTNEPKIFKLASDFIAAEAIEQ
jgi:hypothetical protein